MNNNNNNNNNYNNIRLFPETQEQDSEHTIVNSAIQFCKQKEIPLIEEAIKNNKEVTIKNNKLHKSTLKKVENQKKVEETLRRFEKDETLFLRKISMVTGNVRKDSGGIIQPYKGVYGEGFIIDVPYWNPNGKGSGRYHQRYYYIFKKNSDG